jgi:DNA-binding transcriptional LysR family regulator
VTFWSTHIVPILGAFLERHPALEIEAMLDDRNVDLIESGVDVALRLGDLADSSLTARKIGQSARVVVATPTYIARHGKPQSPLDLDQHESVVYEVRGAGAHWTFRKGEATHEITLRGRLRMNAAEGVRAAVLAHLGITVGSEWMFTPDIRSGAVVPVLQTWTLAPIDLWAVLPSGRQATAKARAFVDFITNALSDPALPVGRKRPVATTSGTIASSSSTRNRPAR